MSPPRGRDMKVREAIWMIEEDGWFLVATRGSHRQFKHPYKPGRVALGTLNGILTLTLLMFAVLIPFFGFGELQRVLGEEKLSQLFFRPRKVSGPARARPT